MYQFRIIKQDKGGYRFELGGIRLLIDDYEVQNDRHILRNPHKAIGYFDSGDNLYGISNGPKSYDTAEAFYDALNSQYRVFTGAVPSGSFSNQA